MSRLGGISSGNPAIDNALRLIDEQLSELYSLHGKLTSRDVAKLPALDLLSNLARDQAASPNRLYANLIPKAIARVGSAGEMVWAINIAPSTGLTSKTGTGTYVYKLLTPMQSTNNMAVFATPTAPSVPPYQIGWTPNAVNQITLTTYNSSALADQAHVLIVFGEQEASSIALPPSTFVTTGGGGTSTLTISGGVLGTRLLTAGDGLTGGGDLSADRTFNVGAGNGIVVNANDVAVPYYRYFMTMGG